MIRPLRAGLVAMLAAALAACAEPAPKPAPPPVEAAVPRTGVVGHVSEVKERGYTRENWQEAVANLFSNQTDKNVSSVRYEVTVFYDDGTSGVVKVDQKPALQPGQRIRVVGNKIEPLRR